MIEIDSDATLICSQLGFAIQSYLIRCRIRRNRVADCDRRMGIACEGQSDRACAMYTIEFRYHAYIGAIVLEVVIKLYLPGVDLGSVRRGGSD